MGGESKASVVGELISSEEVYVRQLTTILEVFAIPLRQRVDRGERKLCKSKHVQTLFGHLELIASVNSALLEALGELSPQAAGTTGGPYQGIGTVLLKHFHFFRIYIPYLEGYTGMLALLDTLMAQEEFHRFARRAACHPHCNGLSLASLLITPVQRIPRYVLLLERLRPLTPKGDPDWADLGNALELIRDIAEQVNAAMLREEERQALLALQREFTRGRIETVVPGRRLMKRGQLSKMCRKGPKQYEFILLSDLLLYAEPLPQVRKLKLHRSMELGELQCVHKNPSSAWFEIMHHHKSFSVRAASPHGSREWVAAIQSAQAIKGHLRTMFVGHAEYAPVWIPDADAPNCTVCSAAFTVLKRRHHCRKCGAVVCGTCSVARRKQKRYCHACLETMTCASSYYPESVAAESVSTGLSPELSPTTTSTRSPRRSTIKLSFSMESPHSLMLESDSSENETERVTCFPRSRTALIQWADTSSRPLLSLAPICPLAEPDSDTEDTSSNELVPVTSPLSTVDALEYSGGVSTAGTNGVPTGMPAPNAARGTSTVPLGANGESGENLEALLAWQRGVHGLVIVHSSHSVTGILDPGTVHHVTTLEASWCVDPDYVSKCAVQWYRKRVTSAGSERAGETRVKICGATERQYVPTADDDGCEVIVEVTPVLGQGGANGPTSFTSERVRMSSNARIFCSRLLAAGHGEFTVLYEESGTVGTMRVGRHELEVWATEGVCGDVCVVRVDYGVLSTVEVPLGDPFRLLVRQLNRVSFWLHFESPTNRDVAATVLRQLRHAHRLVQGQEE